MTNLILNKQGEASEQLKVKVKGRPPSQGDIPRESPREEARLGRTPEIT